MELVDIAFYIWCAGSFFITIGVIIWIDKQLKQVRQVGNGLQFFCRILQYFQTMGYYGEQWGIVVIGGCIRPARNMCCIYVQYNLHTRNTPCNDNTTCTIFFATQPAFFATRIDCQFVLRNLPCSFFASNEWGILWAIRGIVGNLAGQ